MIRQRDAPRNAECGLLWTLAKLKNTIVISAELDSLIG
jgi:hypothetical protein